MKLKITPIFIICFSLSFAIFFSGCKNDTKSNDHYPEDKTETTRPDNLTDAQISLILLNYLKINVEFNHLAAAKTENSALKRFAHSSQIESKELLDKIFKTMEKKNIRQRESEIDKSFMISFKRSFDRLQSKTDKEFDILFIKYQSRYQDRMIEMIKNDLAPSSDKTAVKNNLNEVFRFLKDNREIVKELDEKSI